MRLDIRKLVGKLETAYDDPFMLEMMSDESIEEVDLKKMI